MTAYGMTPKGFVVKPMDAIVSDFEAGEVTTIDPSIQAGAATPLGQLNGIVGGAIAEAWEVLQVCANGYNRDDAEGPALDNIGDVAGDDRLSPKPSSVTCNCTLTAANSPYPAGTLVINVSGDSSRQFSNDVDVVVPADGVYPVLMVSLLDGPIEATAGTLTVITAPVTGFSAVTNPLDAVPGSLLEDDPDYRERQREEIAAVGGSTSDAIRANLLQVPGIVSCTVNENTTDGTVNGVAAHGFQCIVWDGTSGGSGVTDNVIAQAIWDQKPAGAPTSGASSGTAVDAAGNPQVVKFSRPLQENVYMAFTVTLAPGALLATVAPLVKQTVVYLSRGFQPDGTTPLEPGVPGKLNPGVNVVALVYRAAALGVQGVTDVPNLALDFTASPTATANLTIPAVDIAALDTSRITVNGI